MNAISRLDCLPCCDHIYKAVSATLASISQLIYDCALACFEWLTSCYDSLCYLDKPDQPVLPVVPAVPVVLDGQAQLNQAWTDYKDVLNQLDTNMIEFTSGDQVEENQQKLAILKTKLINATKILLEEQPMNETRFDAQLGVIESLEKDNPVYLSTIPQNCVLVIGNKFFRVTSKGTNSFEIQEINENLDCIKYQNISTIGDRLTKFKRVGIYETDLGLQYNADSPIMHTEEESIGAVGTVYLEQIYIIKEKSLLNRLNIRKQQPFAARIEFQDLIFKRVENTRGPRAVCAPVFITITQANRGLV